MITGFCSENEQEHSDTLSLMDQVTFDFAYMFMYSERPGTVAEKKFSDDIPDEIKKRRLNEIILKQTQHSLLRNEKDIGKVNKVLVEGYSKRSDDFLQGRNSANKVVIFPKQNWDKGHYVDVLIERCTSATLFGNVVDSNAN